MSKNTDAEGKFGWKIGDVEISGESTDPKSEVETIDDIVGPSKSAIIDADLIAKARRIIEEVDRRLGQPE